MSALIVPLGTVVWAARIVDESGFAANFKDWETHDQRYRGGRPATLSPRAVLIAWLVVAFEQQPLYATRVAEVLSDRLSPEAAEVMGLPAKFLGTPYEDVQNRVERVMNRILEVLDSAPLPERRGARATGSESPRLNRQRSLTKRELATVEADRLGRTDEMEMKRRRMFRFANDLLHAQYDTLPEAAKTHKLSLAVDATFLEAPSRGMSASKLATRTEEQTVALDFDAGLYVRTYDQRDSWDGNVENAIRKLGYGYELELVVLVSNDPDHRDAVPHMAVGFNFHTPSTGPTQSAREIFDDILEWGHGFGHVSADGLYLPGANPEVLQVPLRRAGAMLTMRYPVPESKNAKGEGTIQDTAHGAHVVEGRFMCPATPTVSRQVMAEYTRKSTAVKSDRTLTRAERNAQMAALAAERDAGIAQRAKWETRVKETKHDQWVEIHTCPGMGADRSLNCPLKPNQPEPRAGVVPLPVTSPPKAPGKICTNKNSVTVSMDVAAKYRQHYRYGSPEWEEVHNYGRQTVESFNNGLKNADNALANATGRRLRGPAGQQFLAIIGVVAQNGRVIAHWLDQQYDENRPAEEPRTRRKRTDRNVKATRTKKGRGMPAGRKARYGIFAS